MAKPADANLKHKRTPGQRNEDLVLVAQMYIRGMTQKKIAAEVSSMRPYSISDSQVFKDIQTIQARWQAAYLLDFNAHKAKELAHIDELERAYWIEWEESRKPKETVQTEKTTDQSTSGTADKPHSTYSREKIKAIKQKRDGNVAYLQGVQWCIEQRCKILGLNAPQRYEVNWKEEARKAGMNPELLENDLYNQFLSAATIGHLDPDDT